MKGFEDHDDLPDKTLSELKEENGEDAPDWDEAAEEFQQDREELHRLAEIMFTASFLGEMFQDDYITLREYFALTEYVEEEEAKLDMTLL